MIKIETKGLGKKYGNNRLFRNLDSGFEQPGAYAVTGFNGSGKSTLLLCLAGFVTPTEGSVQWTRNQQKIKDIFGLFTFCSPAMELFEELSLKEQLNHHRSFVRTFHLNRALEQLEAYGLQKSLNKPIRSFSSGMKQRLKLLMAFNNDVPVLFLDEPCSNLDESGIALYHQALQQKAGKQLLIVATNQLAVEFPLQGTLLRVGE